MSDSFLFLPETHAPCDPIRRRVVVTGAAGRIGSYFAEHSADRYELLLTDRPQADLSAVESFGRVEPCRLGDLEGLKRLFDGADTVLHLAAQASPATPWEDLLRDNFQGAYNAMIAAHSARCRRVVVASSIHAVSGYGPDRQVQADDPVSPGDLYGVSKCFAEALGRFMATQKGLSVIAVRIGAFQPIQAAGQEANLPLMNAFVSRRDLNHLLECCIDDDRLLFAIFHGLSNNPFNRMNIAEARELVGYRPRDDFTAEHPATEDLDLRRTVHPHDERHGQRSGTRREEGPPA